MKKSILLILIFIQTTLLSAIYINEVMTQNVYSYLHPEDRNFEDWIELYNETNSDVDLSNWFISDDEFDNRKYQLPTGTTISANGFLIILANGDGEGLFTNFKLKDGETILLSNSSGVLMDSLTIPETMTDISFGRARNDLNELGYFQSQPQTKKMIMNSFNLF